MSEKSRGAVDVIFQSSQRLVNVIEDFLNITRIELGKMKYDMTVIDLAEMMKVLEGELAPYAKRKKIDFSIKLESSHFHTYADYGKLSQVVSNVIDNAIKYTPTGSVHVVVSRPQSDPKNIHVTVKDTGVGIKAESIPKLFQKFIRADEVGATHISGTGLGLYVAKQIIEAHKGDIRIESEGVGKGSTFTITIPIYEGEVVKK
jgi:signal transduction histidine kinase